jgi:hypothetical protein
LRPEELLELLVLLDVSEELSPATPSQPKTPVSPLSAFAEGAGGGTSAVGAAFSGSDPQPARTAAARKTEISLVFMDNARIWDTGNDERTNGYWPPAGRFIRERLCAQQSWRALNLEFLCVHLHFRAAQP